MRIVTLLMLAAGITFAGCAVVPLEGPPGAYVSVRPPVVVVRPYSYGYAGYHGGPRYQHRH